MTIKNEQYSTALNTYKESAALQQLLEATHYAVTSLNDAFDAGQERYDELTITVAGIQTAFILGGPQAEAIYRFVEQIADENLYEVDLENSKVIGW